MKQLAMEEATDGTTGSAGGSPEQHNEKIEGVDRKVDTAVNDNAAPKTPDASQPTLDEAISKAATDMLPGGMYENEEGYVVAGISAHYKAEADEVRTKLTAAREALKKPEGPATEGATSTAPEADAGAAAPAASDHVPTGPQFTAGAVALVTKGIDRLPVELRDQAHLDSLISEHGAGSVEVQS